MPVMVKLPIGQKRGKEYLAPVGPMGCVSPAAIWARGQIGFASEVEPESPYQRGGPAAYPIATKKENQFSLATPLEQVVIFCHHHHHFRLAGRRLIVRRVSLRLASRLRL